MRGIIVAPWILAAFAIAACSRQESGWQDARREDTVVAYQAYLEQYPAGIHAADARAGLMRLREAEAWARAGRLRTPEAWQRYLADWPDGPHAAEARRLLIDFMPPAAPAPAVPATARPDFEIQLGAYSDEAAAGASLDRLIGAGAAEPGGLRPRIVGPAAGGPAIWRIRAGPLPEDAAREKCAALEAAGIDCLPVPRDSPGEAPP